MFLSTLRLEMCLKTKGLEMAICLRMLSFIAPTYVWYTGTPHTYNFVLQISELQKKKKVYVTHHKLYCS